MKAKSPKRDRQGNLEPSPPALPHPPHLTRMGNFSDRDWGKSVIANSSTPRTLWYRPSAAWLGPSKK